MSPAIVGVLGIVVLLILMFLRMPVGFAFGVAGFIGLCYLKGVNPALSALGTIPFAVLNNYVWSVMPLFIFMGYLSVPTKFAEEFYEGVRRWIGQYPGGLAHAVIIGNVGFGAVCGDCVAAAVAFTTISLPEMRKYKYADTLTLGSIAAGSFISLLIPPSLGFILYGAITETSIGELFIAGIFPGLLLALLYLVVIIVWCRVNPAAAPASPKTTWGEKWRAAPGMWALVTVFVIIIGGLYLGLFTPTEAGAVGAFVVLVLGLVRRKLSWQGFKSVLKPTAMSTGMVLFMIMGVMVFNLFLVMTGLPRELARFTSEVTSSPLGVVLIITVLYIFLGTFMDAAALILLTVPILFPVVTSLGVSPLTFGVIAVMTMGIGALTPPYGIVIFAMSGVVKDIPMYKIFKGVVPFVAAAVVGELIIVFFPQIATFLPSLMMR